MMKIRVRVATVFLATATLLPFQASALSVRQFNSATKGEQTDCYIKAVDKIVSDVARVNADLSKAIRDYFKVTPPGKDEPPGMLAFVGELGAVEDLAHKGKLDLDKVQVEGILLDIVKTDVMPKQAAKDKPPTKK